MNKFKYLIYNIFKLIKNVYDGTDFGSGWWFVLYSGRKWILNLTFRKVRIETVQVIG